MITWCQSRRRANAHNWS